MNLASNDRTFSIEDFELLAQYTQAFGWMDGNTEMWYAKMALVRPNRKQPYIFTFKYEKHRPYLVVRIEDNNEFDRTLFAGEYDRGYMKTTPKIDVEVFGHGNWLDVLKEEIKYRFFNLTAINI